VTENCISHRAQSVTLPSLNPVPFLAAGLMGTEPDQNFDYYYC